MEVDAGTVVTSAMVSLPGSVPVTGASVPDGVSSVGGAPVMLLPVSEAVPDGSVSLPEGCGIFPVLPVQAAASNAKTDSNTMKIRLFDVFIFFPPLILLI